MTTLRTEIEANNSTAAANAVNVGDSITGQLASSSDQDFFKLVAQGSGTLSLGFDVPTNSSGDYFRLELLNATGTSLGSYATGQDKTYSFGIPAAGIYYVKVTPANFLDTNQYSISVSGTFNSVPDSPTYAVSANQSSVNEGLTATFTVSTTNVASGTSLAYTLSGVSASDITGGSLSGTTTVGSNGQATISVPIAADQTTEGNETLTVTLQGKTASTTIVDTSTTPVVPNYSLSANQSAVNEGSTATFTVSTTNVASGTSLAYTLSGVSASDITGGSLSGTTTVGSNGQATISVPITADQTTEGNETLTVTVQGNTASTTIVDTSTTPTGTYALAASAASVNEGGTASFILTTTNVAAGTSLAYTISGVSASDLFSNSLTGSVSVSSNGSTAISIPVLADNLTEGAETMTMSLQGKSASINILDTSTTPTPTYSIAANTGEVSEGSNFIVTLSTTNVPAGTVYPWAITSLNMTGRPSSADFDKGVTEGLVVVDSSGKAIVTLPVKADQLTEGYEDIYFSFYTDTTKTRVLANTTASIKDTSVSGPSDALTANQSSVNEGSSATFLLSTTNVAAGSSVAYTLSGISAADIVGGALSGNAVIASDGQATISIPVAADQTTEGNETLTVTVQGNSASTVIKDTSQSPPPTYQVSSASVSVDEGSIANFTVTTTNVAAGTTLSYALSGVSSSDIVGGALTGTAVIGSNGKATISIPIAEDQSTEGQETLTLTAQGQTASIKINDTSLSKATYELAPRAASVNEGVSAIFDLTTTNVPSGTVLSYTITGVSDTDIVGKSVSGSVSIGANGKGVITVPIANDGLTEGAEYLSVLVQGVSAEVMVNDTSKTSLEIPATFTINAASGGFDVRAAVGSEVNTASSLVVKVGNTWTTGFRANAEALLKWHQNPASVGRNTGLDGLSTDQALAALDRGLTGSEQSAFITLLGLIADVEIKAGMPIFDGNLVLPAVVTPSYQLQALSASVNEGTNAQFQVTTTNVAAGTELGYTLSGQGITSADIIGGQLSGKVIIGSNGQGTISVGLAPDQSTEGSETLIVTLEGKQSSVSIQDTSTPPRPSDTTPPSLLSVNPSSGARDVAVNQNVVFTFNENIAIGSGLIQLLGPGGVVIESFNVQTSNRLTWIANQLTIDPTADLLNDQTYRIVIPNGAIDDLTGNDFAGTSVELTTVGQAGPPPGF